MVPAEWGEPAPGQDRVEAVFVRNAVIRPLISRARPATM